MQSSLGKDCHILCGELGDCRALSLKARLDLLHAVTSSLGIYVGNLENAIFLRIKVLHTRLDYIGQTHMLSIIV